MGLKLKSFFLFAGLLSPALAFALFTFHVDRDIHGRWLFTVWAQLESVCLKDRVVAQVAIVATTKQSYAAQIPVLPALSMTKGEAENKGMCLILFDEQIKAHAQQDILFDFSIRLITTRTFRDDLVSQNSASDRLTLEQKIMGRIVPDRYPSSPPPIQRQPVSSSAQPQPSPAGDQSQQAPATATEPSEAEHGSRAPSPSYSPRSPSPQPTVEQSPAANPAAAFGLTDVAPHAHYLMPAPRATGDCSVPHLLMPPPPLSTTGTCPHLAPSNPLPHVDISEGDPPAQVSAQTISQEEPQSDSEEEEEEEEEGALTITITSL